jgi:integrase
MARKRRGWGKGYVKPPARPGGPWSIRYPDGHRGRTFEGGFPSEALAVQALEARRVDAARRAIGQPADPARLPTLAALGDAWVDRRVASTRNGHKERAFWRLHIRPALADLRGPALDVAWIRGYVEGKRAAGLSGATVRTHVCALSQLLQDCLERPRESGVVANPCFRLPPSVRLQIKPGYDPTTTPFLERLADVAHLAAGLPEPIRTGYAIGVLAGLRTGEVRALRWESIDLERRQIAVREAVGSNGQIGPTKSGETRVLPIAPSLLAVLRARKIATGGAGLVVPPANPGRRSGPRRIAARTIRSQTLNDAVQEALEILHLERPGLDFYRTTRHTYASHFVLAGGDLNHLAKLLGHTSTIVTQRYAHLRPEALAAADVDRLVVDLVSPRGTVTRLDRHKTATQTGHARGKTRREPA